MTYIPYYELFYGILHNIANEMTEHDDIPTSSIQSMLGEIYKTAVDPACPVALSISPKLPACIIPAQHELNMNSANYFAPELFSSIPLDSLYQLICCILLERSVIFQSRDLHRLTSSMY